MKFKCSLVAEFKSSLPGFPAESPQASLSLGFLQNGAVNPYLPWKFKLDAAHVEVLSWARHPTSPRVVFINLTVNILFFIHSTSLWFLVFLFSVLLNPILNTAFWKISRVLRNGEDGTLSSCALRPSSVVLMILSERFWAHLKTIAFTNWVPKVL